MLAEEVVDLSPKSPMVYDPQTGEVRELTQDDLREIAGAMTGSAPTKAMVKAGARIIADVFDCGDWTAEAWAEEIYRAMVDALLSTTLPNATAQAIALGYRYDPASDTFIKDDR